MCTSGAIDREECFASILAHSARPHNIVLWRWAEMSVELATGIDGKNPTFSCIFLDPDNRLRHPPVNLFFAMC